MRKAKEVKLAESTSLVLLAQLLFNQVKIVCLWGVGRRRLTTRDVLKSIIHAIHIHRDSCYWLIEKKHLLQLNKLLLKRNSNQFDVVGGRGREKGATTPRDNKNSNPGEDIFKRLLRHEQYLSSLGTSISIAIVIAIKWMQLLRLHNARFTAFES